MALSPGWSWWHLAKLGEWMAEERGQHEYNPAGHYTIAGNLPCKDCGCTRETGQHDLYSFPREGTYTFQHSHAATALENEVYTDGTPGKWFTFMVQPGDEYRAWRQGW